MIPSRLVAFSGAIAPPKAIPYVAQAPAFVIPASGAPLTVERDDDKNPVIALREVAEETIALEQLRDSLVRGMQKHVEMDEPEETPDLEQTLFGIADPTGPVIGEDSVDEEAVEEELEEDMLAVADEDDVDLSGDDSPEADLDEDEEP